MRRGIVVGVLSAIVVFGLVGCSSARPYVPIDLASDLSQETLRRYEGEWEEMRAAGHADGMATLERTNWWPLGLVAYHRDASVMRMPGPEGPTYTVMNGTGIGPISILYAGSTHATFNARGERISIMKMASYLWMHLAMTHESEAVLSNGAREKMSGLALFMHLINIQRMGGHTYVSLFTVPNALGATTETGHQH